MGLKPDNVSSETATAPIQCKTMNFRKQLRHFLDHREMTASQLAKKARVPKQSISGWLAGSSPRDVRQVKQVADVLGVGLECLLFGDGPDKGAQRITELDALLGDGWISGLFEVRFRRVKR